MPQPWKTAEEYNRHLDRQMRTDGYFDKLKNNIAGLGDLLKLEIAAQLLMQMNDKYGEEVNYACNEPAGILEDIREGAFETAIAKCNGNWEPAERGDAWSGGFADNH